MRFLNAWVVEMGKTLFSKIFILIISPPFPITLHHLCYTHETRRSTITLRSTAPSTQRKRPRRGSPSKIVFFATLPPS